MGSAGACPEHLAGRGCAGEGQQAPQPVRGCGQRLASWLVGGPGVRGVRPCALGTLGTLGMSRLARGFHDKTASSFEASFVKLVGV